MAMDNDVLLYKNLINEYLEGLKVYVEVINGQDEINKEIKNVAKGLLIEQESKLNDFVKGMDNIANGKLNGDNRFFEKEKRIIRDYLAQINDIQLEAQIDDYNRYYGKYIEGDQEEFFDARQEEKRGNIILEKLRSVYKKLKELFNKIKELFLRVMGKKSLQQKEREEEDIVRGQKEELEEVKMERVGQEEFFDAPQEGIEREEEFFDARQEEEREEEDIVRGQKEELEEKVEEVKIERVEPKEGRKAEEIYIIPKEDIVRGQKEELEEEKVEEIKIEKVEPKEGKKAQEYNKGSEKQESKIWNF
ncbi:MAG: hypothetical protein J6Y29_03670 [Clostridiales bacterium]|nr:hypothetical protein [Clostridiales bacterium]